MKFKSALLTQASGSVGGITFAHNSAGMYIRARAIPTDPATAFQQAIRQFMSTLNGLWVNTLTTVQRTAWNLYAANTPLTNSLGDPINVSGIAMYQRYNVAALQAGLQPVNAAPTTFDLGTQALPTMGTPSAATQQYNIDYGGFPPGWESEDGAFVNLQESDPQNASINFYKGPFRFSQSILGDSVTPIVFPLTITSARVLTQGQRLFIRMRLGRADGRLSPPVVRNAIVAA